MLTRSRCTERTLPTPQKHPVHRKDGRPAYLVCTAYGWSALVAGRIVATRTTWKEALAKAQAVQNV